MLLSFLTSFIGLAVAATNPIDTFANVTVFQPDSGAVSYARTESLTNGTLLATWSDFAAANNTIPIYRSADNGFSWYTFGSVTSDTEGRRLVQPHLLYLNESFGDWDAGSVLLAVNAVDDKSTNIEVYGSADSGESWSFVSTVATGGKANTTNGATPVWEPFLMMTNHKVVCYYSDQRDTQHGQKLSHQTTSESLDAWGSAVDDVAFSNYSDRPGMTTVAKLPNGKYILTFEYAMLNATGKYRYPIYYKISNDPENFGTEKAYRINVNTGVQPNGGPYVTWSPIGGVNGTIVVSDSDHNSIFVNRALGDGIWTEVKTPAGRAYSREVRIPTNDETKLRIAGGAEYGQTDPSQVLLTIMDLAKALNITS
ncbi:BNR/Asp-box repeat protein [Lindgomyces ingoldianus]|uniref:BNR/Asp-box repeat protein n=1 Tax=Lindgomyces ingoldianus TaxID=673940 RepID=A0ACB6QZQ8_9PLEO|nr:BNR/Asp-box repeat protein [Lindgomyces ingoldianus]KAF2472391.1 BNR/Asp-box repeat protein [Lindgomyces ingoldianus]